MAQVSYQIHLMIRCMPLDEQRKSSFLGHSLANEREDAVIQRFCDYTELQTLKTYQRLAVSNSKAVKELNMRYSLLPNGEGDKSSS